MLINVYTFIYTFIILHTHTCTKHYPTYTVTHHTHIICIIIYMYSVHTYMYIRYYSSCLTSISRKDKSVASLELKQS